MLSESFLLSLGELRLCGVEGNRLLGETLLLLVFTVTLVRILLGPSCLGLEVYVGSNYLESCFWINSLETLWESLFIVGLLSLIPAALESFITAVPYDCFIEPLE